MRRDTSLSVLQSFAKAPTTSTEGEYNSTPSRGTRPRVGARAATPQNAAGRPIEPMVCVPSAASTKPAATAAAEPDDEPPGE